MHPQTPTTPQATAGCHPTTSTAPLFPPRDADAETFRAWLAGAAWPEVVFGARLPAGPTAQ